MRTLILYATKHGATRKIAKEIAKEMEGATLCDLKASSTALLTEFDCVILGSPIYAGSVRKEAKAFAAQNAEALQSKAFGLFLSGIDETRMGNYLTENFEEALLENVKVKAFLGGIFDPAACGLMERFLMKHIAKATAYTDMISHEKIVEFVEQMEAHCCVTINARIPFGS